MHPTSSLEVLFILQVPTQSPLPPEGFPWLLETDVILSSFGLLRHILSVCATHLAMLGFPLICMFHLPPVDSRFRHLQKGSLFEGGGKKKEALSTNFFLSPTMPRAALYIQKMLNVDENS